MSKTKKQSKADKDFIAKIATIGISTAAAAPEKKCPDCGHGMKQVGMVVGMLHGHPISGPVYGHGGVRPEHFVEKSAPADEQSLSA